MEAAHQKATPHIAIIPSPGLGHLIPLTEFAKRLVLRHNLSLTFLIPTDGSSTNSQLSILQTLPSSISHLFLSPVDLSDLPTDTPIESRIFLILTRSFSPLRDSLRAISESTRLAAVVLDVFGFPALDLVAEFGVPGFAFYAASAFCLCFDLNLPELDRTTTCEYRNLPEPVQVFPGSVSVHGVDFMDPVQDRKNDAYMCILEIMKQYHKAAGVLVNSFVDLEPGAFKALMQNREGTPPVYPIGPLVRADTGYGSAALNYSNQEKITACHMDGSSNQCIRWLDEQPSGSVLFVSFGSGGTLSHEQMIELARGLEMSGQRFLWAFKTPNDKIANAAYLSRDVDGNPSQFLPEGFLDRTKGLGLVVPSWAPQVQILSHGSTGGFLTHCGWNSTLESIVSGVPLIAWPLYAEQRLNAVQLTEDLKVALRVKHNEKGIVEGGHIGNYVKSLIKGEEGRMLRERMRALQSAAKVSWSEDGLSTKTLDELAQMWHS